MAFRKINRSFEDKKEISGFWSRKEGESITGKLTALIDTVKVSYPFYLIELTNSGGTINDKGDKSHKGKAGELIAISATAALKPLADCIDKIVRVTATGKAPCTFMDEKGRKKATECFTFDIEVDDGQGSKRPPADDTDVPL